MRRALVIGIDDYPTAPLQGCVEDAAQMAQALLEHPATGERNFDVRLYTCPPASVDRAFLRREIEALFKGSPQIALLYFSGHGIVRSTGGVIVSQAFRSYDEGLSMDEILVMANRSEATERIIILDCCHAGALGSPAITGQGASHLADGLTVLASSSEDEASLQKGGRSEFTALLLEGLRGGAADLLGTVTSASLYNYVDQSLGSWGQRPLFKANVSQLVSLSKVPALVSTEVLRRIPAYFPDATAAHHLDPGYEHSSPAPDEQKVAVLEDLRQMYRAGLVLPHGASYLFDAAMESKSCVLTARGRHYWRLVREGRV